jgi:hypothetical protein
LLLNIFMNVIIMPYLNSIVKQLGGGLLKSGGDV